MIWVWKSRAHTFRCSVVKHAFQVPADLRESNARFFSPHDPDPPVIVLGTRGEPRLYNWLESHRDVDVGRLIHLDRARELGQRDPNDREGSAVQLNGGSENKAIGIEIGRASCRERE